MDDTVKYFFNYLVDVKSRERDIMVTYLIYKNILDNNNVKDITFKTMLQTFVSKIETNEEFKNYIKELNQLSEGISLSYTTNNITHEIKLTHEDIPESIIYEGIGVTNVDILKYI